MTAALIRKELRDLAPAAIVICVIAMGFTLLVANAFVLPVSQLALICGGLGAGIGVTQGLLDRRRRDDPFLLHRPMSSTRLHAVRGAAASAIVALGAIACCVLLESTPFESAWRAKQTAMAAASATRPQGWIAPLQELPSLAQYLACIAGALVLHAVARLAMTARTRLTMATLVVVLPTTVVFGLLSIGTESPPWPVFAAVWLVAATLAPLQLASTRPPSLERARAALLLVVVLFVSFEGLRYVTTPLWRMQFQVLPRAGLDTDGAVLHWRSSSVYDELGYPWRLHRYDAERRPVGWERSQTPVPPEAAAAADIGGPQIVESPLYRAGAGGPPWMPLHRRWDTMATRFEGAHLLDRALPPGTNLPGGGPSWDVRDGRLHLVAPGEPEKIIGTLGPDGWLAGAATGDLPRFAAAPAIVDGWTERGDPNGRGTGVALVLDSGDRALFVVEGKRVDRREDGASWGIVIVKPDTLTAERIALPGNGPIRSLRSPTSYSGTAVVAVGDEVVALRRSDRSLHRMPWEPDVETPTAVSFVASVADQANSPTVLVTRIGPPEVIGARLRFRFVGAAGDNGDAPIVHDVHLAPVTTGEHAMAWARRGLAIVRPPVLSIASTVSPRPTEYGDMLSWWLRDPLYAGGDAPFTLALSLLLGAICALRARSQARLRRPSAVLAWSVSGLFLGPAGLVWLRLANRRRAVRRCACGRKRAVDVERCTACDAGWPGPAKTGAEVLVTAEPAAMTAA